DGSKPKWLEKSSTQAAVMQSMSGGGTRFRRFYASDAKLDVPLKHGKRPQSPLIAMETKKRLSQAKLKTDTNSFNFAAKLTPSDYFPATADPQPGFNQDGLFNSTLTLGYESTNMP
ncbi:hypothetical protein Ciccas_014007, partial [Cichlidogyrus casuarinus]